MVLTLQNRISLVQCYYECARSFVAGIRKFRRNNNLRNGPCSLQAYRKLIRKFEDTGCVTDRAKSGRPKVVNDISAAEVLRETEEIAGNNNYGICSANQVAKRLQISYTTVWRILRRHLKMYPYKMQVLFELKETDKPVRYDFALRVLAQIQQTPQWLDNVLWTDEAHFLLSGGVNTHNCRIWSENHPHTVIQQGLHDLKVTVWIGFTSQFILEPYFFEENQDGQLTTVTVTGERYFTMLRNYVIPRLHNYDIENIIFMQDGAPPIFTLQ